MGTAASLTLGITQGDFSLGIRWTFSGKAPGIVSLSVPGASVSNKEKTNQCTSQHRDKIKFYAGVMLRISINVTLHPSPRRNYI